MFELMPLTYGESFRECRYNGYGVARKVQNRKIFDSIFQKSYMDFYLCDDCKYIYLGKKYCILFDDLDILQHDNKGCYINGYNNEKTYLCPENIKIVCSTRKKCTIAAWVQIYNGSK